MKQLRWFVLLVMMSVVLPFSNAYAVGYDIAYYLVSKGVYLAGFEYNQDEGIYSTRHFALQRKFGFNNFYDMMTVPVGMVIDVEPVRFDYNGKKYMIELWKGQYYSGIGAEIGFYVGTGLEIMGDPHYRCATTDEELNIAFTLENKGDVEYSVQGRHWWLTGFKPGIFADPSELSLTGIQIQLPSSQMAEAFEQALIDLGYTEENDELWRDGEMVGFAFTLPKNEQPWSTEARNTVLEANRKLVDAHHLVLEKYAMPDFSPESIAEAISGNFFDGISLLKEIIEIWQ